MNTTKAFFIGLLRMIIVLVLLPFLVPLFLFDMILWIGGKDPMETPVRKFIDNYFF